MGSKRKTSLPWIIAIAISLTLANILHSYRQKPLLKLSQEDISYTLNQDFLYVFSMGNQRLFSSYLWILTLLQGDTEHYKKKDGNSWMYLRFSTIAKLDPLFYENYKIGGIYLAIIKDDVSGSVDILKKGIRHYPEDFWLNYYLGFNYLHELKDRKKGLYYFDKIRDHPIRKKQFPLLTSTLAKLHAHQGDLKTAFNVLFQAYQGLGSDFLKKHFEKNLYSLKAKIDLACLNQRIEKNCQRTDFFNRPYVQNADGVWSARGDIHSLELKLRDRKSSE